MSWEWAGLIALLAGAPAIILFVAFYARSYWRSYPVGRALMYMAVSLSLVYLWVGVRLTLQVVLDHGIEDALGWKLLRVALFTGVSATMWRLFYVLLKIQRDPNLEDWMPDRPTVTPDKET